MSNNIFRYWQHNSDDPFDLLFQVAPILMHSIDANGRLLRVSTFWAEKLGYKPEEMIGRHVTDFQTEPSRKYAQDVALPKFFAHGKLYNQEYVFLTKDGCAFPVLLSAVAEYDDTGAFRRSLAIIFDNSDYRRISEELKHNQRLEAMGPLIGGVAHDFNNLLTVVQGNLEIMKDDPAHPDRAHLIEDAWHGTRRAEALTRHLLTYNRRARLEPEKSDVNKIVRQIDPMLRRLMPSNIALEVVTAGGLWESMLDAHQLETALLNIVNNARDAMQNGGRITIETCNVRISDDFFAEEFDCQDPGRYVMIAVTDTGQGMPPAVAERVFESHFTTKPEGQGNGLGMAMVYGFVKRSGGIVRVYSEEGFGTTVRLFLPAVISNADLATPRPAKGKPKVVPVPDADVLVVEDDPSVRKVLVAHLEKAGFDVAQAESGDIALTHLNAGYRPKVLLTDIVMPGLVQGPQLARMAEALDRELKVIFVSGYPREAAIHGNGVPTDAVQLVKPISGKELIAAVRAQLEAVITTQPEDFVTLTGASRQRVGTGISPR